MTAEALVALFTSGALVAPLLTAFVNRPDWSRGIRQSVAVGVSVALAVGALFLTNGFDSATDVAAKIALVIGLSTIAYEALWKPTGVTEKIELAGE